MPGILTVVIFAFSLCVNEFIYAFTFTSSTAKRTLSVGVPNELIRGDLFFWQWMMAAVLIPSIPLALLYNAFLDRFIKGFTGGAFRYGDAKGGRDGGRQGRARAAQPSG